MFEDNSGFFFMVPFINDLVYKVEYTENEVEAFMIRAHCEIYLNQLGNLIQQGKFTVQNKS